MFKKIYWMSIITSVLLFAFGLILILNAEAFIKSITYILGIGLLLVGILPVVDFFRNRKTSAGASVSLISGIFSIVCGLMFLLNDQMLLVLIPIVIGVWLIINGVNKMQLSLEIRDNEVPTWLITFIYSLVIIVLGAFFVINPVRGIELASNILGIIMCIYAVLDIVDCVIIRVKFKEVTKATYKIETSNIVDEQ